MRNGRKFIVDEGQEAGVSKSLSLSIARCYALLLRSPNLRDPQSVMYPRTKRDVPRRTVLRINGMILTGISIEIGDSFKEGGFYPIKGTIHAPSCGTACRPPYRECI